MHGIMNLALGFGLMASAITNVSALTVNFKRYSQPDCDTDSRTRVPPPGPARAAGARRVTSRTPAPPSPSPARAC